MCYARGMQRHHDPAYRDLIEDLALPDGSWVTVHWAWRTEDDGKHFIFAKTVYWNDPPGAPGESWEVWPRTDVAKLSGLDMLDMLFGNWDPTEVHGLLQSLLGARLG